VGTDVGAGEDIVLLVAVPTPPAEETPADETPPTEVAPPT